MLQFPACAVMLGSRDFLYAPQVISRVHRVLNILNFLRKLLTSLWFAFELMWKPIKAGMPVYRGKDRSHLGNFFKIENKFFDTIHFNHSLSFFYSQFQSFLVFSRSTLPWFRFSRTGLQKTTTKQDKQDTIKQAKKPFCGGCTGHPNRR